MATAWLIYHITNSEAWLGIDAFASGIPTVLLLPWGGVISDQVNRRKLLIWRNIVSALLAVALAALVYVSPDEYRGRITSLQSLGFRLGQPLGSLVAGFVARAYGVQIAFCTFGVAIIAAVFIARELSTSFRMHKLMQ